MARDTTLTVTINIGYEPEALLNWLVTRAEINRLPEKERKAWFIESVLKGDQSSRFTTCQERLGGLIDDYRIAAVPLTYPDKGWNAYATTGLSGCSTYNGPTRGIAVCRAYLGSATATLPRDVFEKLTAGQTLPPRLIVTRRKD